MSSSSDSEANLAKAKAILSTAASVAATVMLARSVAQDLLPDDIRDRFFSGIRHIVNRFSSDMTIIFDQYEGLVSNEVYEDAKIYLGSILNSSARRIKVNRPGKEEKLRISMEKNEAVTDIYNGVKLTWQFVCEQVETKGGRNLNAVSRLEIKSFELTFPKKFKDMVLDSYLHYLAAQAKSIKAKIRTLKLHTIARDEMYGDFSEAWVPVTLDHPSTFDTLALDPVLKNSVMEDLDRFLGRRDFYRRVGRAWKRGYLLYGPPGTGKSSLIAAMANHLNFDIYDLELTEIDSNSDLRRLLVATANKSILIVEDIDCTIELNDRTNEEDSSEDQDSSTKRKVTLSGFLNFIDGLWSSCGDERIIIFTTNHIEKLDPALIRPGRMDMHIHMSYCTPSAFRILAANYLNIEDHKLFREIEEAIQTTEVTPAEVAEQLIRYHDADTALRGLIEFLEAKKLENEEAKKADKNKKDEEAEKEGKDSVADKKEKSSNEKRESAGDTEKNERTQVK